MRTKSLPITTLDSCRRARPTNEQVINEQRAAETVQLARKELLAMLAAG
jgi:hypothetical protein